MTETSRPSTETLPTFAGEYRRCADRLYVWMRLHLGSHLGGRLSADDLIQETWCRAFQAWPRFDPGRGTFRAWLFGIGERVLLEELRRLGRRPTPVGELPSSMTGAPARVAAELTSISERAARSEFAVRLLDLAAQLQEEERQLLLLRGVEGLEYEAVGSRLGFSSEAARSRWRRLRERIRGRLPRLDFELG